MKKYDIRELTELSLFAAAIFVFKEAMSPIPNVNPMALLIIVGTRIYGKKVLLPIYCFVVFQVLLYGMGVWVIAYLYIWAILVFAALPFRKSDSIWLWSGMAGIYGFFFGLLCSLPYFFVGGWQMSFSFWLSGLYYDFLHGVSNAVMTFVLHKPIYKLLKKLHERDFGKGE